MLITNRERILATLVAATLATTACDTGSSAPVDPGLPMDGNGANGNGAQTTIERFEGDWAIFAVNIGEPDGTPPVPSPPPDTVIGTCSGSVNLTTRTSSNGFVEILGGSYVVLADRDCSEGTTISGGLVDIDFRQDGGIDFGLEVPGSDGNMFEDFLVGSGLQFRHIRPLGCEDPQADSGKDALNHLDGTLLRNRLLAAASASMLCPDAINGASTVQVKLSVDLTKTE